MSDIPWCDITWNAMIGCTPVVTRDDDGARMPSGCDHCYAEGQVHRFGSPKCSDKGELVRLSLYDRDDTIKLGNVDRDPHALTFVPRDPVTGKSLGKGAKWTGAVWLLPGVLDEPLRRRKPTTYFVNSLSDVFHESVVGCEEGRRFIAAMFGVMAACPQHTFQILTKRPEQARKWFAWLSSQPIPKRPVMDPELDAPDGAMVLGWERVGDDWELRAPRESNHVAEAADEVSVEHGASCAMQDMQPSPAWPLPNVWMLTSISTQPDADQRIPELLAIPAALHGVSAEPLLGPIDLRAWLRGGRNGEQGWDVHEADGRYCDDAPLFDSEAEAVAWAEAQGLDCYDVEQTPDDDLHPDNRLAPLLDWIIIGGESGPKARPCEIEWLRSLVGQCREAGVAAFVKQLGSRPVFVPGAAPDILNDAKGGDMAEWPADLRVREMPR